MSDIVLKPSEVEGGWIASRSTMLSVILDPINAITSYLTLLYFNRQVEFLMNIAFKGRVCEWIFDFFL